MSEQGAVVAKRDLPKEIWRVANTLSDEAQTAAIRKCRELGFDVNKGNIPLEETLINISQSRDILLEAVDKGKLVQIPLSIQHLLLRQAEKVSESLTALTNGTDAVVNLTDAAESLTASVWQFGLYNLSDKVLGFQQKINQLKAQEVLIRDAHREADGFKKAQEKAAGLLSEIAQSAGASSERLKELDSIAEKTSALYSKVLEHEQKTAGLKSQAEQHDSSAAQYTANAKTAAADVEAIAAKAKTLQTEIESTRTVINELQEKLGSLLSSSEKEIQDSLTELRQNYEKVRSQTQTETGALRDTLEKQAQALNSSSEEQFKTALDTIEKQGAGLSAQVGSSIEDAKTKVSQFQSSHESRLNTHLKESTQKVEDSIAEFKLASAKSISDGEAELTRLVGELDTLEGRIRESIERATGFTLFHSFQKRQLDLAKSKDFWGKALAVTVLLSLGASIYLIFSLSGVREYNAAFYLKLAISLPLIYAIAFCSVQYSRERRLEEEYAFKSSISISLEPYQKLVEQLVDKDKPEELAKYTAFIIDSVQRVFTSPTAVVFDDHPKDKTSAEKVIKAFGQAIDPLLKAIKK